MTVEKIKVMPTAKILFQQEDCGMRKQVFISYRRDGGLEPAMRIYEMLKQDYEVFFDMKSLRNGRFDEAIEDAIKHCTDFVLILSKNVFSRVGEEGDWISREIKLAYEEKKNVIPIIMDGFVFSPTNNDYIRFVECHNGIQYSENVSFREKLCSFLTSVKKCTLDIELDEDRYVLSDAAIEALKAVYRNSRENEQYDVRVVLNFPDIDATCEKLVSEDITGTERLNALAIKKQQLLIRKKNTCSQIEYAIEYMISDICNLNHPSLRFSVREKELASEGYEDKHGICHSYEDVCIWVVVIEELLKEFTCESSRADRYMNDSQYVGIDCVLEENSLFEKAFSKERICWYFKSFVKAEECTEPRMYYVCEHPLVFSLKPQTVLTMILPDFYYNVGYELDSGADERLIRNLHDYDSSIRYLHNYWYGLS